MIHKKYYWEMTFSEKTFDFVLSPVGFIFACLLFLGILVGYSL
jgi:hypothetical protein